MNSQHFWSIIQAAFVSEDKGTNRDWFDSLKNELSKLSHEEILLFRQRFDELTGAAYKNDLWGAAYLINGGCSDDGFHAFRCWLVGMGKEVYEKALNNPDSLADVLHGQWPCEADLDCAAPRAWEEKTGGTDEEFYCELNKLLGHFTETNNGEAEDWDFDDDDEMRRHFPRLCEHYLTQSEN